MIEYKDHTLNSKEIAELNKQGHNLDESEKSLYIIRFLWNNQLNKAYQPGPFQVDSGINDHLAKDAIDMPYIVGPDPEQHLEGADEGLPNTADSLLKIQANYSIGDIKKVLKSDTDNFYGIIKVYPDYHEDVLNNKIPMLVSPTFDPIEWKGSKLLKANFLNLNAVNSGGYPVALTKIVGACKNGIKQCMSELAPYAAAGSLKASREDKESFSSTILGKLKPMSQQEGATPDLETVVKDVDALKQGFGTLTEKVDAIAEKVGVDNKDPKSDDAPPAQASGPNQTLDKLDISKHADFVKLRTEFDDLKKLSDKREKQISEKEQSIRVEKATSIVEILNKGKKLSDEDKETQIKNWVEKKDADDNLENLDLVESTLKVAVPQTAGNDNGLASAAGPEGIPEINSDIDPADRPKNSSIMAKTLRVNN